MHKSFLKPANSHSFNLQKKEAERPKVEVVQEEEEVVHEENEWGESQRFHMFDGAFQCTETNITLNF